MKPYRFEANLERPDGVGTWTYLMLPSGVDKKLPLSEVKGTIDGTPYRSTLLPSEGGRRFLVVRKEIREAIRKTAGDKVRVLMEVDSAPRVIEIPKDLNKALSGSKKAREFFESLSPSRKKQYTDWIGDAKKAETRTARIRKSLELLTEQKKLK